VCVCVFTFTINNKNEKAETLTCPERASDGERDQHSLDVPLQFMIKLFG